MGCPFPRASAFGLSPGLGSPGPLGRRAGHSRQTLSGESAGEQVPASRSSLSIDQYTDPTGRPGSVISLQTLAAREAPGAANSLLLLEGISLHERSPKLTTPRSRRWAKFSS